jgi:hypothetical protein
MSSSPTSDTKRVRASERALRLTLKAMKDAGIAVDKVCITGAQIEIHCGGVEEVKPQENDRRIKQW